MSEGTSTANPDDGKDMMCFESHMLQEKVSLIPLPDTPEKPSLKKTKREGSLSRDQGSESILDAIRKLSLKHDATFQKIATIEKTTQATSKELESLSSTVKELVSDVGKNKKELDRLQTVTRTLEKDNAALKTALIETQRYNWKPFLKIHGLKEQVKEDIRIRIIEVLHQIAPDLSTDILDTGVDVVHRLGPPPTDGKCRSVIVRFSLLRVRSAIWQAGRKCKFLLDNKLTISEPVPPEDRAAREKLWPLVQKARKAGKKASYRDYHALIDGKRHDYAEVMMK